MGRLAPSSAAQQPDSRSLPFSTHLPSSTSDMGELDSSEIAALKDCFDTFDFFNACRGTIDGTMVGDIMRCAKLNPTQASINANGGTEERGKHEYTLEELLVHAQEMRKSNDATYDDYLEVFKSFDRDSEGKVQKGEMDFILTGYGDSLPEEQLREILGHVDVTPDEDGFMVYQPFVERLLKGHTWAEPPKKK